MYSCIPESRVLIEIHLDNAVSLDIATFHKVLCNYMVTNAREFGIREQMTILFEEDNKYSFHHKLRPC